jgi:hypothetical protein
MEANKVDSAEVSIVVRSWVRRHERLTVTMGIGAALIALLNMGSNLGDKWGFVRSLYTSMLSSTGY